MAKCQFRFQGSRIGLSRVFKGLYLLSTLLVLPSASMAVTRVVSNISELNTAVESLAQPGDVILLNPGLYVIDQWDESLFPSRDGTAQNPITIRAANLGDATIRLAPGGNAWVFQQSGAYWIYENLVIEGTCVNHSLCEHAWHITGNSDGTIIRNNDVRDFNAHIKINGNGDFVSFPDDVLIESNNFYATARRQTGNPVAYLDAVGGKRTIVRNNYYYDCATDPAYRAEAWCAFIKGGGRDSIFEGNLVECERDVPNAGGEMRVGLSFGNGNTFGPVCENNQCQPEHTDGILRNNIIMNCSDAGIYNIDSWNIQVHNNTLYETGGGIQCRQYLGTGDCVIRNNIVGSSDIWARDGADIVQSNNLENVTAAQFGAWFTDPANADFSLQNGAQFVDQGFNLGGAVDDDYCQNSRPVNASWDLGAVEYGQPICDTWAKGAGAGEPAIYTLGLALGGSGDGTVTSSPSGIDCGSDCSGDYNSGTSVQLTATPSGGSFFVGWSGHADCSDGRLTMNGDRSCTATFDFGSPPDYTLTVTKAGTGSGTVTSSPSGIACGGDCSEEYTQGTDVQLTATPSGGSSFNGWSGDADCSGGQLTMNADRTCTAAFTDASLSLMAAYDFDEGAGSVVGDASGNSNVGNISGASWTASGYFGSALTFDGSNDWVTVPDASSLDLTTGVTLEAWVRPTSLSGWRTALMKEISGELSYGLWANDDGYGAPAAWAHTSSSTAAPGSSQIPLNTWTHLAQTYDGAMLRLFVNGAQVGSRTLTGQLQQSNLPLRIGGNNIWGEYFAGRIDEIRIYNRPLTATEIQQDMTQPVGDGAPPTSYSLAVSKSGAGSGTVTSSPAGINCGSDCAQDYSEGTSVQLTATPAAGSVFGGWSGHADCNDGQLTMNATRNCTATFDVAPPTNYTLAVSKSGAGSGTVTSSPAGINCGSDCAQDYSEGTSVQLTATPAAGSVFGGWSGHADCNDGQLTMNATRNCTATFDVAPPTNYALAVSKSGAGSGTVTSSPAGINCGGDCAQDYSEGTSVQLTASPAAGSVFGDWSGHADCNDGQLTMNAARNCTATFQPESPFESKIVPGTSTTRWKKAKLRRHYSSMVAVCNPQYDNSQAPLAARIRNAHQSSFEVRLERLDGDPSGISGVKVLCTIIEAGSYPESLYGVNIEAARFTSTQTDRADSWSAESRSYSLSFDNPVVLGQVMTSNDDRFSIFWSRGGAVADPPSSTELWVGKHVAEDPDFDREAEEIGYIVIESGRGSFADTSYEAGVGPSTVKGIGNQPPYSYGLTGAAPHPHAAVSMAGMKGNDGGSATLYGDESVSPFALQLAVDEDQLQDSERSHSQESIAYLIFESAEGEMFWDDFESGDASSWGDSVP